LWSAFFNLNRLIAMKSRRFFVFSVISGLFAVLVLSPARPWCLQPRWDLGLLAWGRKRAAW
jgi:hypothetical protein